MQHSSLVTLSFALIATACSNADPLPDDPAGIVQLAVGSGESFDVAKFELRIYPAGATCGDPAPIFVTVADLETETAPSWIPEAEGHAFSSALFVLPPADYLVCAAPLQADDSPSAICAPVSDGAVTVSNGVTSEVVLVSPCDGAGNGAIDVVAALGQPPTIDTLDIAPSKFITVCESATITAAATDSETNPVNDLSYSLVSQPMGSMPSLTATNPATFSSATAGTHELLVTATDAFGNSSTLQFPIHVQDAVCP